MSRSFFIAASMLVFIKGVHNAPAIEGVPVDGERSCQGMETSWDECPGLQDCMACDPVNCSLSAWTEWTVAKIGDGCFGLCHRNRRIVKQNNDCGSPCGGLLEETHECPKPAYCPDIEVGKDCIVGPWTAWTPSCQQTRTPCGNSTGATGQQTRTRVVTQQATFGGKACNYSLGMTRPCPSPVVADCKFVPWLAWTPCSLSCGGGTRTRHRSLIKAVGTGKACAGILNETMQCNPQPCQVPCAEAGCQPHAWSPWTSCEQPCNDKALSTQRTRTRINQTLGPSCNFPLKQVAPCEKRPSDCQLSPWTPWSLCSACANGEQNRSRTLLSEAKHGGACRSHSMREVQPCTKAGCPVSNDCAWYDWSNWTQCSVTCDMGSKERSRKTTTNMTSGDKQGCFGSLKEIKACVLQLCPKKDCVYAPWKDWSGCDATCGGGMKHRTRSLLDYSKNGHCPALPEGQLVPCNTLPCRSCVDGQFSMWTEWSICSATCGSASRSRTRFDSSPGNSCGKPAEGVTEEYQVCDATTTGQLPCSGKACELSEWGPWSVCKNQCSGLRTRQRAVIASGSYVESCPLATLQEHSPCFNGTRDTLQASCSLSPNVDCEWAIWEEWSACSVPCGKGDRTRSRLVEQEASMQGQPCQGPDKEVARCYTNCSVPACELSAWSVWFCWKAQWPGIRSQQTRTREVVEPKVPWKYWQTRPVCPVNTVMSETMPCTPAQPSDTVSVSLTSCVWSAWSAWGGCPGVCSGTRKRVRTQTLQTAAIEEGNVSNTDLYNSVSEATCQFKQTEKTASCTPCVKPICTIVDLEIAPWTEWVANKSTGLCKRTRAKSQDKNKCGNYNGALGNLSETMKCIPPSKTASACMLSPLIAQAPLNCTNATTELVKSRLLPNASCKGIIAPEGGGEVPLQILKTCAVKVDCVMGDWSLWDGCKDRRLKPWSSGDPKCQQTSTRVRTPAPHAIFGGKPCTASVEELKGCIPGNGPNNGTDSCTFSDWNEWTPANPTSGRRLEGRGHGHSSSHSYRQEHKTGHVDRELLPQQKVMVRWRTTIAARRGWTRNSCKGPLEELRNPAGSVAPCSLSDWMPWSSCGATCGVSKKMRSRQAAPTCTTVYKGGSLDSPCSNAIESVLEQVAPCNQALCPGESPVDCVLSQWGVWSACSATCGYGKENRSRVVQTPGVAEGKGCKNETVQQRLCNIAACPPAVPCAVAVWTPWTTCDKSCGAGAQTRTRTLTGGPTNWGAPCKAGSNSTEIRACNIAKCRPNCTDGVWGEWMPQGVCTKTCKGGYLKRTRSVKVQNNECGNPVAGFSEEAIKCNDNITCPGQQKVDCSFGPWSAWTPCGPWTAQAPGAGSRRLDRELKQFVGVVHHSEDHCTGVQRRQRTYTSAQFGGALCHGATSQTIVCHNKSADCNIIKNQTVQCAFSQWSPWNVCPVKCGGGQTYRTRSFLTPGVPTCSGALRELKPCGTLDCVGPEGDCKYAPWAPWGVCDPHCMRKRSRAVTRFPLPGGKECSEKSTLQVDACSSCGSNKFCEWGNWADWSVCSVTCGTGKRFRSRTLGLVVKPASGNNSIGGKFADNHFLEDRMQELYRKQQAFEARRHGELFVAFTLGVVAFLAIVAVGLRRSPHGRGTMQRVVNHDDCNCGHDANGGETTSRSSLLLNVDLTDEDFLASSERIRDRRVWRV